MSCFPNVFAPRSCSKCSSHPRRDPWGSSLGSWNHEEHHLARWKSMGIQRPPDTKILGSFGLVVFMYLGFWLWSLLWRCQTHSDQIRKQSWLSTVALMHTGTRLLKSKGGRMGKGLRRASDEIQMKVLYESCIFMYDVRWCTWWWTAPVCFAKTVAMPMVQTTT